jgi:hypothetical protein
MLTIEDHPTTATETGTPTSNHWRTRTKVLVATGAVVTAFAAAIAIDLAMAHSSHVHKGLHSPSHSATMHDGRLVIRSDCSLAAISTTCAVDYVVHVPNNVAVKSRGNGSDVVISAVDGDVISVKLPDDGNAYRVGTHTNGGSTNVGIRTDPASKRTIDVETNGGNIDVRYATAGKA